MTSLFFLPPSGKIVKKTSFRHSWRTSCFVSEVDSSSKWNSRSSGPPTLRHTHGYLSVTKRNFFLNSAISDSNISDPRALRAKNGQTSSAQHNRQKVVSKLKISENFHEFCDLGFRHLGSESSAEVSPDLLFSWVLVVKSLKLSQKDSPDFRKNQLTPPSFHSGGA